MLAEKQRLAEPVARMSVICERPRALAISSIISCAKFLSADGLQLNRAFPPLGPCCLRPEGESIV